MIKGGGDDGGRVRGGLGWTHLLHEDSTETWTLCINNCVSFGQMKPISPLKWHEDGLYFISKAFVGVTEMIQTLLSSHTHRSGITLR